MEAEGLEDSKLGNLHIIKHAPDFHGFSSLQKESFPLTNILISHLVSPEKSIYFFRMESILSKYFLGISKEQLNILVVCHLRRELQCRKKSLELDIDITLSRPVGNALPQGSLLDIVQPPGSKTKPTPLRKMPFIRSSQFRLISSQPISSSILKPSPFSPSGDLTEETYFSLGECPALVYKIWFSSQVME